MQPDFDNKKVGNISAEAMLWQMPGYVLWKDLKSSYIFCNQNAVKLFIE
jgi:hypothetical protein